MTTFIVPDMSCGHCVSSITKAIAQVAPDARVSCDLPNHQVTVENIDAETAQHAMQEAGYASTVKS